MFQKVGRSLTGLVFLCVAILPLNGSMIGKSALDQNATTINERFIHLALIHHNSRILNLSKTISIIGTSQTPVRRVRPQSDIPIVRVGAGD